MAADDEELQRIREKKRRDLTAAAERAKQPRPAGVEEPLDVNDRTFDNVINSAPLVLVDFWAPWCGPCKQVEPSVREMARRYAQQLLVGRVNTDVSPVTAGRLGVQSIPTLILFKAGVPVDGVVGAVPLARLEAMVRPHLPAGA